MLRLYKKFYEFILLVAIPQRASGERVFASPLARSLAAQKGIDLQVGVAPLRVYLFTLGFIGKDGFHLSPTVGYKVSDSLQLFLINKYINKCKGLFIYLSSKVKGIFIYFFCFKGYPVCYNEY